MLGRQHFTLSVSTGLIVLTPFFMDRKLFAVTALLGVAVGSLIPDVDASDATVFHTKVSGLHGMVAELVNSFLGPFLPVFGYLTKYLVYMPSVFLLNLFSEDYVFEDCHRSFTHSILGVLVMAGITGFLLWPPVRFTGLDPVYLVSFLLGYTGGAFLHMLQDSFTVSGIAWNQPFSSLKLKGELRTGKDNSRPRIFLVILLAVLSLNFGNLVYTQSSESLVESFLLPCVCWSFFAWMSGLEVTR